MDPILLAAISAAISFGLKTLQESGQAPSQEEIQAKLLTSIDSAVEASDQLAAAAKKAADSAQQDN